MDNSPRIPCEKCKSMILPATAAAYGGLCAPCHKRLNELPRPKPEPEPLFSKILGMAIPVLLFLAFFIGIPLGYKLVLGGRKSTVEEGTIHSIQFVAPVDGGDGLQGRPVRILSDYAVIKLESGREMWVPEGNIAAIEFEKEK